MACEPFEVYKLYLALSQHFKPDSAYDAVKYHYKIRATEDSFLKHRNRFSFVKLGRKYSRDDLIQFLAINMINGDAKWPGDLMEPEAEKRYTEFRKIIESYSYHFSNEIDSLLEKVDKPSDLFAKTDSYPVLLDTYINQELSLMTMIVLDRFLNFTSKFDKLLGSDDFIWSQIKFKMKKFKPFIQYDVDKVKKILRTKLEDKLNT